jgi:hypothetical protein
LKPMWFLKRKNRQNNQTTLKNLPHRHGGRGFYFIRPTLPGE